MTNIEFLYVYRDGSNYKKWGRVIFSNPDQLPIEAIQRDLREAFFPDGLFIASQIRVPNVFLYLDSPFSFDDHCFHEFGIAQVTIDEPNDLHRRSISSFIAEVIEESKKGWKEFDPYDSRNASSWFITRRIAS